MAEKDISGATELLDSDALFAKPPRQQTITELARGHKRSRSQPDTALTQISQPHHRRSISGGVVSGPSAIVLNAIELLSRRAQTLRRLQDGNTSDFSYSLNDRSNALPASPGKVSVGIAMFDHVEFGSVPFEGDETFDMQSLDSSRTKSEASPLRVNRNVDDLIAEYENTIHELQALLVDTGITAYDDDSTFRSFLTSTSADLDRCDSYSFGQNSVSSSRDASPIPAGDSDNGLSIQQLQQLLRDRDEDIAKLNAQLSTARSALSRQAENDKIEAEFKYKSLECRKDNEIDKLKSQLRIHNSFKETAVAVTSHSCSPTSAYSDKDVDNLQDAKIFSLDDYDADYSTPSHSLPLRLSIAAAKEREAVRAIDPATPRLEMEGIDTPRHLSGEMISRQMMEINDLRNKLHRSMTEVGAGKIPTQLWVEMEKVMSYVNRILCDIVRSGQTMNFTDVKMSLLHANTCDIVETFEKVRPLIAQHFKSIVSKSDEIISIWSRLDHLINGEYDKVDILRVSIFVYGIYALLIEPNIYMSIKGIN